MNLYIWKIDEDGGKFRVQFTVLAYTLPQAVGLAKRKFPKNAEMLENYDPHVISCKNGFCDAFVAGQSPKDEDMAAFVMKCQSDGQFGSLEDVAKAALEIEL